MTHAITRIEGMGRLSGVLGLPMPPRGLGDALPDSAALHPGYGADDGVAGSPLFPLPCGVSHRIGQSYSGKIAGRRRRE